MQCKYHLEIDPIYYQFILHLRWINAERKVSKSLAASSHL